METRSFDLETSWLETALELAVAGHRGKRDRGGNPYLLHVMEVVLACRGSSHAMIVAALHDLVEEGAQTLEALASQGFPVAVLAAVDALSRRDGESWDAYIGRVKLDPLAVRVKRADLESNLDVRRLSDLGQTSLPRLERYRKAWAELSR